MLDVPVDEHRRRQDGIGVGRASQRHAVLRLDPADLRDGHGVSLLATRSNTDQHVDRYDPPVRAFSEHLRDPNRINLRKAGRAAIVLPLVLAVGVATGNDAAALFASFGALAALVFSDFGGPLARRFRAYVALAVIGGLLVAVGSAFADTIYPAAVAT